MSIVGIKIQARNEYFISPTIPTRDEVRKVNYSRRKTQLSSEGFYSKIWKPYIFIGHPLNLNKALETPVKLEEERQVEIKSNNETSESGIKSNVNNNRNLQSSRSYKRPSEKLEQLNKNVKEELKKSELVNFNVRIGHSFFSILQKEENNKKTSIEEEMQLQKLKNASELIAPAIESENDSEPEYQVSEDKDHPREHSHKGVKFHDAQHCEIERLLSRQSTGINKKRPTSRPFTPMYNNISNFTSRTGFFSNSDYESGSRPLTQTTTSDPDDIRQASLYRQLSSLHWLLEAMFYENVDNMPRISVSWTLRNEDNNLTSTKNRKEIKAAWEKYVSKPDQSSHKTKNRMMMNTPLVFQTRKISGLGPNSKSKEKENELESTVPYSSRTTKSQDSSNFPNNINRPNQSAMIIRRRKMVAQAKSVCEGLDKDNNDYEYKKKLHLIRMGKMPVDNKRIAESTQLHPKDNYSDKLEQMLIRHHEQSNQMIDERMASLREHVRNMSEYKIKTCVNKYRDFHTRGAFHQMLKTFRGKNAYQTVFAALDRSKNKVIYTDWFLLLEEYLIKDYGENKRIVQILEKIRQYALNTITKFNVKRLLSVLKCLSDWEIRHPDISTSIKFITDNIVSMSDEDYQIWFDNNFK